MNAVFSLLGILTLSGAVAAMVLRNLVHCALALAVAFAGLAGLYVALGAPFVGFAQVLIYLGAVAILIVFAILLNSRRRRGFAGSLFFLVGSRGGDWAGRVRRAGLEHPPEPGAACGDGAGPAAAVKQIGDQLMTRYVLPLEVLGLLLTAALIGAVVIAMRERNPR